MKKKRLRKNGFIFTLLLSISLLCSMPSQARGEVLDNGGAVVASDDTRWVATIEETDATIIMHVMLIGQVKMDIGAFGFFYNPSELVLTDQSFNPLGFGSVGTLPSLANAISIDPTFLSNGFNFELAANSTHLTAGISANYMDRTYSSISNMNIFYFSAADALRHFIVEEDGGIITYAKVYFSKVNEGRTLLSTDIGIGIKSTMFDKLEPAFGTAGAFVCYAGTQDATYTLPEYFLFRSPSSVETDEATDVTTTTAVLNGSFMRGNMLPADDLIDAMGVAGVSPSNNGIVDWDAIDHRGFIYSEADVELSIIPYSNVMLIEGVEYPFPSDAEILAGTFTRGENVFYIASEDNSSENQTVVFDAELEDLKPATEYYAWSFIKYTFQTSNPYPNIGERITFETEADCQDPEAPIAVSRQTFCFAATVADLIASVEDGITLEWFETSTGTTALDPATALIDQKNYYAKAIDGNCSSTSTQVMAVLNYELTAPSATTPQTFCPGATVGNLQATGTGIKWYSAASGGSELLETQTLLDGTIYYAAQSTDDCESTSRTAVKVVIEDTPPATPVIATPQSLCGEPTLADIATDGNTNMVWYANATGGAQLPLTTPLVSGTTYYAAISAGTCESEVRAGVAITIGTEQPSTPVITSPQSFCAGATLSNIEVPNNQIVWYAAAEGGDPLPADMLLAPSITYYAAQQAGDCESAVRAEVIVNISAPQPPTGLANQTICGGGTLADLTVTGTGIVWYNAATDGTQLPSTTPLTSTTYYAAQSSGTCEGARFPITVTVLTEGLIAPVATTPQEFCGSATVADLQATGTGIKWYSVATDGTALGTTTALVNGAIYYAAQSSGNCESTTRTAVKVIISTDLELAAPTIASPQSLCAPATLADVATDGNANIVWYDAASNGTQLPLTTSLVSGTTYYAAISAGTCESATRTAVSITLGATLPSAPTVATPQSFCLGAIVANIVVPNNQVVWYTTSSGGTPLDPGTILATGYYYAAQSAGDCESTSRTQVAITVGTPPVTPTGPANQTICGDGTLADLTITGSGIVWYSQPNGGTPLPATTPLTSTTYYAAQSSGNCVGARFAVAVTVLTDGLIAPIATTPQEFCSNATIADLQATGTGIKWYDAATAGNELISTTALVDGTIYYASQSVGDCESITRTAVKVTIDDELELTAPVITSPQNLCAPATLADVATDGNTNIVWYDAASGGMQLPLNTTLTTRSYYAAIQAGDCESATRAEVKITIAPTTVGTPTITSPQAFCLGATISNIAVPNNQIVWYTSSVGGQPLDPGTVLINGNYFAAQSAGGCESTVRKQVAIEILLPLAPTGPTTQTICGGGTLADLTVTGSGIVWYDAATDGTQLPLTTTLTSTTYYAAQSSGTCEGPRLPVAVTVLTDGLIAPIATTPQEFCSNATIADLQATGTGIKWYDAATAGNELSSATLLLDGTIYYASQSVGDCESVTRTAVKVTIDDNLDLAAPVIKSPQSLCAPATLADIATDGNTNIVWYSVATGGAELPLTTSITASGSYYAAIQAGDCESATRAKVDITIGVTPPTLPAVASPQIFCPGATLDDIAVPNNQIVWYDAPSAGNVIPAGSILSGGMYYAAQSAGACESTFRTAVQIVLNEPLAPTGPASQAICGSGTLADLTVTGSGIVWYDVETGGTQLPLTTPLTSTTYYAAQSSGDDCIGARFAVAVTVLTDGLIAPIATTPQEFCANATIADLQATGTGIKWYSAATGGAALATTAALADGTIYYASQSVGDCESTTRTPVKVVIDNTLDLAAPAITTPQTLCSPATLADIATDGNTNIVWYNVATGGTELPLTTALSTGSYYAAIEAGDCESATRAKVDITIVSTQTVPAPTVTSPQIFCPGATLDNIAVPNNQIVWYDAATAGNVVPAGSILNDGTYYAAQSAGACESTSRTAVVIQLTTPPAPTGPAAQTICGSGTLADLTVTGSGIVWYGVASGGTQLPLTTPLTSTTYYAAQSSGDDCIGARFAVAVTVLTDGLIAPIATTPQEFCDNATIADLQATGTGIKWYAVADGGSELVSTTALADGTIYYASQSIGDCESTTRTAVKVVIDNTLELAAPTIKSPQTLCSPATLADVATDGNTNIVWYNVATGGTELPLTTALSTGSYYAAIEAGDCQSATRAKVDITIVATQTVPTPTVTSPQLFCPGATLDDIAVPNNQIVWYDAPTAGNVVPAGTVLNDGMYYAAQTAGACESQYRAAVQIELSTPPAPTGPASQTICGSGTLADLTVTGSGIVWYGVASGGTQLPLTTTLTSTTYYAAQSSGNCVGARMPVAVTVLTDGLIAPIATTPQEFCDNATIADLQATGTGIKWYAVADGGSELVSTTALVDGTIYYASQSIGDCESTTRTAVKVVIDNNLELTAPVIKTPQTLCSPATLADVATDGNTNIVWYNVATGGTELVLTTTLTTGSYYAALQAGDCESATRTKVDITIVATQTVPAPTVANPQIFCPGATLDNIAVPNNQIVWYDAITAGNIVPAGSVLNEGMYYAAQNAGACQSTFRTPVQVVLDEPLAPTGPSVQTFCTAATLADLVVTGSGIVWYDVATNGSPLDLTELLETKTYYAAQSSGDCEGARFPVSVIVSDGLIAPIATTPQEFCSNATVANLQATGTGIKWYSVATGGTALTTSTALVSGNVYYAAQSNEECESVSRTAVRVILNDELELGAPTITSPQAMCSPATLADIATDGNTNIVWYSVATGGTALPLSTILSTTSYYAAIEAGDCESATRTKVDIVIGSTPPSAPVITTPQAFCPGATIANIEVPNNQIVWYAQSSGGTSLDPGTLLTAGTYYAAQSAGGCESTTRTAVTINLSTPAAPTGPAAQTVCYGATLANLNVTGSGIVWYDVATNGTPLSLTELLDTKTYYAAQSAENCEGDRLAIAVTVLTGGLNAPYAITPQIFCVTATVANLQATGAGIKWYDVATGGTQLLETATLVDGKIYYAAQSNSDCESLTRTAVRVLIQDVLPDAPVITSPQSLCSPATLASIATDGNSNIVWYASEIGGTALPLSTTLSTGSYFAAIRAGNCESATRTEVEIVIGSTPPSAPTITTPQSFCPGATIANIVVPNDQIIWYESSTGGSPLADGTILNEGYYYAAQGAGGCESDARTQVRIILSTPPAPEGPSAQTICGAGTLANLTVSGTGIVWYNVATDGTPLSLATPLANGTYYAAQSSGDCEGTRLPVAVTVLTDGLTAPTATTPQTFCSNADVSDLQATGTGIKWYASATGGVALLDNALLSDGTIYYAAQSVEDCESTTRTAVKVIINNALDLAAPTIKSPQSLCSPATLADIATDGNTNIVWYNVATGGTELPLTTALSTGSYYAAIEAGDCQSATRTKVDITIGGTLPTLPAVTSPQFFCAGATLEDIVVPNNQLVWYDASSGGNVVPAGSILTAGMYYAAQSAGACESTYRTPVQIVLSQPLAPTGPASQTFCGDATVADLEITGSGVVWYNVPTGGTPLDLTDALTSGTYYAAQSSGNCQGARFEVEVVVINGLNAPTAVTPQIFCDNATVSNLQATGAGIKWYAVATGGTALTAADELVDGAIYYAAQSSNSCESTTRTAVKVVINNELELAAPTITSPQALCLPATIADIATDGNANIVWYSVETGGTALLSTTVLSSGSYYAAIEAGDCESATRTKVDIVIGSTPPSAPAITTPQAFCPGATIANIEVPNNQIVWYTQPTGGTALTPETLLTAGTYYAAQDAGGCESATRTAVIINLSTPLAPTAPETQTVCGAGTLADLEVVGSGIVWYNVASAGTQLPLTTSLVDGETYYAAQSSDACEGARSAITVTVLTNGLNPPIATTPQSFCTNATVSNLQATGVGVKWYDAATGGTALSAAELLEDGKIYYAAQSIGDCESDVRTGVKANVEADLFIAAPTIKSPQAMCAPATLADIATDGNTNIVWYANATDETALPLTTSITASGSYYAAIQIGDCESTTRTQVVINLGGTLPSIPTIATPQPFCLGATIENIVVPNNQIVWYANYQGGTPLAPGTILSSGMYYGAQSAGGCESLYRAPVQVVIGTPNTPDIEATQNICGSGILADITATGSGIVWYNTPSGGTQLPLTTPLVDGIYYAAQSSSNCEGERLAVTVTISANIAPPTATTPQTFCSSATVADLQAAGSGIQWYTSPTGGAPLTVSDLLTDGTIYYASQSSADCESATRTAVKAIIDDNVILSAPNVAREQSFCGIATLADMLTNGSNIVWYSTATGGTPLPMTTILTNGSSYYAAQSAGGTCVSATRTEVTVTLTTATPSSPTITSPQYFCEGAMISNISVPNNQIVWYASSSATTPLPENTVLAGGYYYAVQQTGECESATRTAVQIILTEPEAPVAPAKQAICGVTMATLADLTITGSGIVWYDAPTGGNVVPLDTDVFDGDIYYAAQTSGDDCESPRLAVEITTVCHTVVGTMFPFVHVGAPEFDNLFTVSVKLFNLPPSGLMDPTVYLLQDVPVYTTVATYYDGSNFIEGTPKNPGIVGSINNPGLPIDWSSIGKNPNNVDNTSLSGPGDLPSAPIGMYKFENVAPGDYILEIHRKGFLKRWVKVSISEDMSLGHREILGGDVDDNGLVTQLDMSWVKTRTSEFGSEKYDSGYDFNGDGSIDSSTDVPLVIFNVGASYAVYEETLEWLLEYFLE